MSVRAIDGRRVSLTASPKTIDDFKSSIDVGEVLRGRIIELFPENKVLVHFKGFNLIAQTHLYFKKGDVFFAQVEAKSPKILVKILLPEKQAGFTDGDARQVICGLGQIPTPERIKIVKHLIRHNMAITREMVEWIERYLGLLEGDTNENITTLIFMKTHGLRVSPGNVELIKAYLFNRLNIGDALVELKDIFLDLKLEDKERFLNIIEGLFIKLDKEGVDNQIKDFIKSIGIDYENRITNEFYLGGGGGRQRGPKEDLLKEKNLKMELLRLLRTIKALGEEGLKDSDKTRVEAAINKILRHILCCQLISSGEDSYLYLQLPLLVDNGPPQLVELKVYYEEKGTKREINMDYLNLSLLLHTSKLGVVEIDVSLHQGTINIEFKLEDEYRKAFLKKQIPLLHQGLLSLGYRIGWLTLSLMKEDKFRLDLEREIDLKGVGRIDFRV